MINAVIALAVIAILLWIVWQKKPKDTLTSTGVPKDYLVGLNYLLNEEPDKAVEILIKTLQVDSDTIETYLALGHLFRRRGEVDRAIRIHQNLIARPSLSKNERIQALLALGQDYLRSGVYDRAERLFLEVIDSKLYLQESYKYLIDIYQQEKEWEKAIVAAEKLSILSHDNVERQMAHYYCELALETQKKSGKETAFRYLKKAYQYDKYCVRASWLQGDWEKESGHAKIALRYYRQALTEDADFLPEILPAMVACYEELGDEAALMIELKQLLAQYPRISLILTIAERLQKTKGAAVAVDFLAEQLQQKPSIRGLNHLIHLQQAQSAHQSIESRDLALLQTLTEALLKDKPIYRCVQCGYSSKILDWYCPSCKHWNTVKPIMGIEGE
ncbi:MAG: lipopolysaccharide assembly protein LapB [Gammaproteobacteria bacterium]|nr:lipopolysaccharide assembly protein LapB [Gammaproteobacteria bacterium]